MRSWLQGQLYTREKKNTLYSFSKDEVRKSLWLRKIPRKNFKPTKSSRVCIEHFSPEHLEYETRFQRDDGSWLIVKERIPTLTADAFPSIFKNCPSYFTDEPPAKRKTPSARVCEQQQREEFAFQELLKDDLISDFDSFSKSFQAHFSSVHWMYRLNRPTLPVDSSSTSKCNEYYTFYNIDENSLDNGAPSIKVAIKVLSNMHIEVFISSERNSGLVKLPSAHIKWALNSNHELCTWTQFESLLGHFSKHTDDSDMIKCEEKFSLYLSIL